jgi:hypothetical protein
MKRFAEDVDGQGNSLNVFARNGVARKDGQPKTLADEKAEGARPGRYGKSREMATLPRRIFA